ncbi:RloB family protein [Microgenomates group bacterium]|nr:RloB family protein [Microgenomates group bacterium]
MTKTPRAILICCEGKTEQTYFDILIRLLRISAVTNIKVQKVVQQHKKLVDRCVKERVKLAEYYGDGFETTDIETWAVCDNDEMTLSYPELTEYAKTHHVLLGFSQPQFESYLLQHFEPAKDTKVDVIIAKLAKHGSRYGLAGVYNKTDLKWLEEAIFNDPEGLIKNAVVNSNQRDNHTKSPFLTVQKLTKRLKDLELK